MIIIAVLAKFDKGFGKFFYSEQKNSSLAIQLVYDATIAFVLILKSAIGDVSFSAEIGYNLTIVSLRTTTISAAALPMATLGE
jgi:hypothetical protein